MLKALTLLGLLVVVSLAIIGERSKKPPLINGENPQSYTAPTPATLGAATNASDSSGLNIYLDKIQEFQVEYPGDISIKKENNGSVVFSKEGLSVVISKGMLSGKDTINTIAEQSVNLKMEKMGDRFKLLETISPVSIGSLTGVTFTSEEYSKEITYFYVPQGLGYILITNSTDTSDWDLLATSDDIIYSLELL
ncbi:MAG: hypothetical protein UW41_C0010G0048 [Candidatus Collierbacteria bacterium GW2011_GWC2_44_18]|uniref:Uncharacterized protein n=2 Tax=Microgenomates group TaxID=1794810 RepID=A0A0G1M6F5_9BACT|nr:MAG: hypothetical protein UW16_C0004G0014 [Microgenomates group bacterium GW2011_GWC1_44_10]KKT49209.1 MAG: hypothetical protein UW41_C0010G0048 [Candidatus Collierbacteria bacterium GW2011_GWC2_44_18]KKT67499.1 MAG: hypothetical protein UW60_C0005G0013 [Candidatus Woesebacteria bacterium GW2011_GWA2_44_33]